MKLEVILFYKYVNIPDPERLKIDQLALCTRLNLKGRVLIAQEGINGTLEGQPAQILEYQKEITNIPGFSNISFKSSFTDGSVFPRLRVKVRNEIVSSHLGEEDIDPNLTTGKYLAPEELHAWFETGREFYIVDMRNDFETKAGFFKGSFFPGLDYFRGLKKVLPNLEHLREKVIVTVCTGGVRCEKASGFLVQNGFENVYQLHGGIVTYMEKYPNEHFKGKLYVFDNRVLMGFNTDDPRHEVVGKCGKCGKSSENYVNCAWDECHLHFICCQECLEGGKAFCGDLCRKQLVVA